MVVSYVSPRGVSELESIHVGFRAEATGGAAPVELLARVPSDECGCPEELWHVDGLIYLIHLEPDGTGELLAWLGDDELEESFTVSGIDDLRARMFARHAEIVGQEPG